MIPKKLYKTLYSLYIENEAKRSSLDDFLSHDFYLSEKRQITLTMSESFYRCSRCGVTINVTDEPNDSELSESNKLMDEGSWLYSCDGELMDDALT